MPLRHPHDTAAARRQARRAARGRTPPRLPAAARIMASLARVGQRPEPVQPVRGAVPPHLPRARAPPPRPPAPRSGRLTDGGPSPSPRQAAATLRRLPDTARTTIAPHQHSPTPERAPERTRHYPTRPAPPDFEVPPCPRVGHASKSSPAADILATKPHACGPRIPKRSEQA